VGDAEKRPSLATVLLVDDDAYIRDSLAEVLSRRGVTVRTAGSSEEALAEDSLAGVDAVVTDLKMPGEDGASLIRGLADREPELPILVLTGYGTIASAVECVKAGAVDYLLKPTDPDELLLALRRALDGASRQRELAYLRERAGSSGSKARDPLGRSAPWRRVLELVEAAAPTDTPVLLLGESGSGKGEVAKLLHRRSARRDGPFVQVNCAAIPMELFESEFFGHRRGAFTGAVTDREGRFRVAHGGTLMLDEIDALPPPAQAKVLRVLEEGVFERVGESRPTRVDVRLVTATNSDLSTSLADGRFRPDLYYRINVLTIALPPLRERGEDVVLLAEAFLEEIGPRLGKRIDGFHPETVALLTDYRWPGNVRELRNVIERGVLLEPGRRLTPDSLPSDLRSAASPQGGSSGRASSQPEDRPELSDAVGRPGVPGQGADDLHLRRSLQVTERRLLEEALRRAGGVRRRAAELLGVDERNLAYYLKKHGLHREADP
jgi:two-component system response regulator AtoC